ncbi:MAG: hypothetical protein ABI707_04470 [Ferruginibacter sp.]
MDRNFHTDEFERLLREKSDEFRMYPSKRIWHSIYNNIHPGRKWPSVAMGIMLITALLLTGYLNTKNTNLYTETGKTIPQQKIIAQAKSAQLLSSHPFDFPSNSNTPPGAIENNKTAATLHNSVNSGNINNAIDNKLAGNPSQVGIFTITNQPVISDNNTPRNDHYNYNIAAKKETINSSVTAINTLPHLLKDENIETSGDYKIAPADDDQTGVLTYAQKTVINDFIQNPLVSEFSVNGVNPKTTAIIRGGNSAVEKNNLAGNKKVFISAEDKDWIENYALYNRPATKKWANKLAWQMYATPSVVYRKLYSDPNFGDPINAAPPLVVSPSNADVKKVINQKPSLGFEIGTGLQYSIFKGVKLKAGLQLNYTRYNSEAFQNTHPVATKVTMHDYKTNLSYEEIRTTPYSNKSGLEAVKLHNETFQVSLPIGADLKLIGNENLQWNFGITIQPGYVPAGKSYLISSDGRNYVKEVSMLNRWNLNAGFETFISYKADNGLIFQLGPQFRKQLFSTNSKQIAVEEKLLNYGLKFGISKTLK